MNLAEINIFKVAFDVVKSIEIKSGERAQLQWEEYTGTVTWESWEGLEQYAVYTDNFPVSEPQHVLFNLHWGYLKKKTNKNKE